MNNQLDRLLFVVVTNIRLNHLCYQLKQIKQQSNIFSFINFCRKMPIKSKFVAFALSICLMINLYLLGFNEIICEFKYTCYSSYSDERKSSSHTCITTDIIANNSFCTILVVFSCNVDLYVLIYLIKEFKQKRKFFFFFVIDCSMLIILLGDMISYCE